MLNESLLMTSYTIKIFIITSLSFSFASIQIFVWICLCVNTRQTVQIDVTLVIATIALACEGTKYGLIFDSQPCISDTFWEYVDTDEVSSFHKADNCFLSRGTYMSTVSLVFYSLVIIYLSLVRIFPSYNHVRSQEEIEYDDVTIPSFLGSIGKSVGSKLSKGSSVVSSKSSTSGASRGKYSRRGSNGISNIMEPIIEGDDDDRDDDFVNSIVGGNSINTRSTKNSKNSSKSGGSGTRKRHFDF